MDHSITRKEKIRLTKAIYPITKEEALNDYEQLRSLPPPYQQQQGSRLGNTFVNYFTDVERLDTKSKMNISFFELWNNRKEYSKKNYVKNYLKFKKEGGADEIHSWWCLFNLYFGSINVFKPITAMVVYDKYKPKSVLDPTMGWGGRLVGATILNIPSYYGIDLNKGLRGPYTEMLKELKGRTKTKITIKFQDAVKTDYSKIEYDMVLTSPPYYNVEIYNGTKKHTKEEWNKNFYEPLFTNTWRHLRRGGHYCLNVPVEVYETVCIGLWGKADDIIPLYLNARGNGYKEMIYVWKK